VCWQGARGCVLLLQLRVNRPLAAGNVRRYARYYRLLCLPALALRAAASPLLPNGAHRACRRRRRPSIHSKSGHRSSTIALSHRVFFTARVLPNPRHVHKLFGFVP
jgi:hypothetical protein